ASVFCASSEAEVTGLGGVLGGVLQHAGWVAPVSSGVIGGVTVSGVNVLVRDGGAPSSAQAAQLLVDLLRAIGLDVSGPAIDQRKALFALGMIPSQTYADIKIMIGSK